MTADHHRIALAEIALACVADAAYGTPGFDIDAIRERALERGHEAAESACIYRSDCTRIIDRYESDVDCYEVEALAGGRKFKASEWREALTLYAVAIAASVIGVEVENALSALADAADVLVTAAVEWGAPDLDASALKAGRDCPHGWALHDKEDADGVHYWSEPYLEGCRAVAVQSGSLWLSCTWTPGAEPPPANPAPVFSG